MSIWPDSVKNINRKRFLPCVRATLDDILDWPVKNRVKSALAVGVIYSLTKIQDITNYIDILHKFPQEYSTLRPHIFRDLEMLVRTVLATVVATSSIKSLVKPPYFKNMCLGFSHLFKHGFKEMFTNKSLTIQDRQAAEDFDTYIFVDPIKPNVAKHKILAGHYLRERNYGAALEHYKEFIEEEPGRFRPQTFLMDLNNGISDFTLPLWARIKGTVDSSMDVVFHEVGQGRKRKVLEKILPRIINKEKESVELRILYALFLHAYHEQEKANITWQEIIELCNSQGYVFRRIQDSKNEVLEISTDRYLKEVFVVKNGPIDIFREYRLLSALSRGNQSEPFCVTPLAYFTEGDISVLITKRKKGRSLEELFQGSVDENVKIKESTRAVQSLAYLHSISPDINLPIYNPITELHRRLVERLPGEEKKCRRFVTEYNRFAQNFSTEDQILVHGDFYPTNVLEGGILLDLERGQWGDAALDLETFLGSPCLAETESSIVKAYVQKREERQQRIARINNRDFYAIHTSLCQTGSFYAQEKSEETIHFLNRAQERMRGERQNELLASFRSYIATTQLKASL